MEGLLLDMALGEVLGEINDDVMNDVLLYDTVIREQAPQRRRREQYGRFNLGNMSPEDVKLTFRFRREHLMRLTIALQISRQIRTDNRHVVTGLEGLCICLRHLAYPNRLSELEALFGLSTQYLSDIANTVISYIYNNHKHLLQNLRRHLWLNQKLNQYSQAIIANNAPLQNCWAFIDGTARPICRPSAQQQEYFSGHKRVHCIKYQSILCPDGIIISMTGAYPGRRHDAGILRDSNLYRQLEECCVFPNGQKFVLYGSPAYGIRELFISPFRNRMLTEAQQNFNTRMSSTRQAVEWGFGKIISEFIFVDFKKNQKLLLQDVSQMYAVSTILTNCHTCLYGSQTSQYFDIVPPTLEEYLVI